MAGDPLQIATPAGVLAYNGENPRGWNDPPTFAFSNKGDRGKPKLDLRKRVSHQQALSGTPSAMTVPNTTQTVPAYTASSIETSGLNTIASRTQQNQVPFTPLSMMTSPFPVPPVTMATQPPVPVTMTAYPSMPVTTGNFHSNSFMPAPVPTSLNQGTLAHTSENQSLGLHPITKSVSVPSELMHAGESHSSGKSTPPLNANSPVQSLSTNLGQPLCNLRTHSYEPIITAHPLAIRSGADINDLHLDDGVPAEGPPQIYNPAMPPTTAIKSPHFHHRSVSFPGPRQDHQSPPVGHITPPPVFPTVTSVNQDQFKPGQSVTPPPPTPASTSIPPTSLSAGNTPKILSPVPSHRKVSTEILQDFDDEEGLNKTMDAFQDVINKYQDTLQKRVVDDVKKRLQVMSQSWRSGKLSKFVKARMIHLAEALDSGNSDEAHRMHVSIMVDHVSEVNQWMVGVKKLISVVSSSATPHS